jgi:hypothetical protein
MTMPDFNADHSIYTTINRYMAQATGSLTHVDVAARGLVVPQQAFMPLALLRGIGFCMSGCRQDDFGCLFGCLGEGLSGGGGGGNGGDRRMIEHCRCVPDSSSSTGRREHCRTIVPGVGSTFSVEDEC